MNKSFFYRVLISGLITLILLGLTSALGLWQYSQSQRDDIQNEVLNAKPVTLGEIHTPEEFVPEKTFARSVELNGTLDCEKPLQLNSKTFVGVLCLFNNSNDLPIVVLLNEPFLTRNADTPIRLLGRLQPAQSYEPISATSSDRTSIVEANIHVLVDHFQQNIYDGFVVVQSIEYEGNRSLFDLDTSLLLLPPAGIEIRNLFYAWQWWIFAGFALFIWVRYVNDEWRKQQNAM